MRFLRWWGRTLWSMLPAGVRHALRLQQRDDLFAIQVSAGGTEIVAPNGERRGMLTPTVAGDRNGDDQTVGRALLTVTEDVALLRDVQLPVAAEADLLDILRHQIDELTPYSADKVFFGARVDGRDAGSIFVRLGIVLRSDLEPTLSFAEKQGIRIEQAALADNDAEPIPIDIGILTGRGAPAVLLGLRPVHLVLGLLLLAVTVPLGGKAWTLSEIRSEIDTLRGNQRRDMAQGQTEREVSQVRTRLLSEATDYVPRIKSLVELTTILPDATWLTALTISGREVEISGITDAPAQLLGLLEDSDAFLNPRFTAPVSRSGSEGRNAFKIGVDLEGAP